MRLSTLLFGVLSAVLSVGLFVVLTGPGLFPQYDTGTAQGTDANGQAQTITVLLGVNGGNVAWAFGVAVAMALLLAGGAYWYLTPLSTKAQEWRAERRARKDEARARERIAYRDAVRP